MPNLVEVKVNSYIHLIQRKKCSYDDTEVARPFHS